MQKLRILVILGLFGSGIVFSQSTKLSNITISADEFKVYANGLIKVQELTADTTILHKEIRQLSDIVQMQQNNAVRDSLIYRDINKEVDLYKASLNACNDKYYKSQNRLRKFKNTTLIFVSTTLLEGLIIYLQIKH